MANPEIVCLFQPASNKGEPASSRQAKGGKLLKTDLRNDISFCRETDIGLQVVFERPDIVAVIQALNISAADKPKVRGESDDRTYRVVARHADRFFRLLLFI